MDGKIDGECHSKSIITGCDIKIKIAGKTYTQEITFLDFKSGDFYISALRDPNNMDYVTSDLAIKRIGSRTIIVLFNTGISGLLFWLLISLLIKRPGFRYIFDELN